MNNPEFSDAFTTLLNSYSGKDGDIVVNEYEKSLYLTVAQKEIAINLYSGRNQYGLSYESTEEARRYLSSLVKSKTFTQEDKLESGSSLTLFKLPSDLAYITMEQVVYQDDNLGCYNGKEADVYPITQDEYSNVRDNPFRGATKYRVLRLDWGDNIVRLISDYNIGEYIIKYLSNPEPIILETLPDGLTIDGESKYTECKLNTLLHYIILERAVQLAVQSKKG